MIEKIKIKYFDPELPPVKEFVGGDWVDLRSRMTVKLKAGEYFEIPLGVAMELPAGYEAHIVPRSSTFKNFGIILVNSMGIVDESYCGDSDEWHFPAYAIRDTTIWKGERICQFRIMKHQPGLSFDTVEHLENPNRGGLGSTGTR